MSSHQLEYIVKYHGKVMVSGEDTVCFDIYCNVTVVLSDYHNRAKYDPGAQKQS